MRPTKLSVQKLFAYLNFYLQFKRVVARSDCRISKPINRSTKRGFTSLAFFWLGLTVHLDVQRNPGPLFNEFSSGYSSLHYALLGRRGGLMVSALVSGASGLGSSPGRGHCVVFLGKIRYSHSMLEI